jgi:large subunit ribosomal protein L28|tara:strand:- start:484 stop:684 length:201 start_codon:yes stop_codon:yes gene_type:complete
MSGNNVSHAHNKTRRRFLPNLHTQRFWLENEQRFIKLKVSHNGLRIIEKLGIEQVVKNLRERGEKL